MSKPLISIITPSYNSQNYIAETITSVINQTYPYWEMIIVDDFSKDNTLSIIKEFQQSDQRIKLIPSSVNQGAGYARNKAINSAKGAYIAFLDADDVWFPEKLEKQLNFMQQHNATVCFSSYLLIDEDSKPLNTLVKALPEVSLQKIIKSNYIGNLTGMYHAAVLGKIYMPLLRKRQDWAMWYACIKKAGKAYGIAEPLAYYRVHKGGISSNKFNLLKYNYNFYRKALNFDAPKATLYFIRFLFEQFFIKSKQTTKHT